METIHHTDGRRTGKFARNFAIQQNTKNEAETFTKQEKENFMDSIIIPKPTVNLLYNGKDCTKDFSKYLNCLTFQDFEDEQSDELTITLNNADGYFSDLWYPEKGDKLTCDILFNGDTFNCGTFTIDENSFHYDINGDSLEVKALATSANFSVRTNKVKNHTGKSLIQIASEIGKSYGFTVLGNEGNLKVGSIIQKNESDIAFLKRIAKQYGYIFNIKDNYLTFIKLDELETSQALFTLEKEDLKSCNLNDTVTKIYGKAKIQYLDRTSKTVKTYTAVGNTEITDTLNLYDKCGSLEEAQKKTIAALKNGSKEIIGNLELSLPVQKRLKTQNETAIKPELGFIAGANFNLTGLGKFEGKYHITSSKRIINTSGYSITGEISKCI